MIPFKIEQCEILEAIMAKKPESKYVEILVDTAVELMTQTNNILQKNLDIWSDDKIKIYRLRVSKYGNVIQALTSILENKSSCEVVDQAVVDCDRLYTEMNNEFVNEWNDAKAVRRGEILHEILLPHMLMARFLKKFSHNM